VKVVALNAFFSTCSWETSLAQKAHRGRALDLAVDAESAWCYKAMDNKKQKRR
jgi:hypothetical protein